MVKGRYASQKVASRPIARLFFTEESEPLAQGSPPALTAVGLSSAAPAFLYRCGEWVIADNPGNEEDNRISLAVRRQGAITGSELDDKESLEHLVGYVHRKDSRLICKWVMTSLLDEYFAGIYSLRDATAQRNRPLKIVAGLAEYLIAAGLDLVTVPNDVLRICIPGSVFTEDDRKFVRLQSRKSQPESEQSCNTHYAELTCGNLKARAEQLIAENSATTSGVTAYAQLRQAKSNIQFQWVVSLVTILALLAGVG
jgi:hypothetical protein